MMKMSLNKRKEKNEFVKAIFIAFVLSILLLFTFSPLRKNLFSFFEPIFLRDLENSSFFSYFFQRKVFSSQTPMEKMDFKDEKKFLLGRISFLEHELGKVNWIKKNDLVPALVLSKNINAEFLIGKGKKDFVSPGDLVLSSQMFILGFISEVYENSSRVSLLRKNGVETEAILEPTHVSFILKGNGNTLFAELPRDFSVSVGDVILNQCFPELLIGSVQKIHFDERDPSKEIFVSFPDSPYRTQYVFVVKKSHTHCVFPDK